MGGEADSSRWEAMIEQAKADGDSLGGVVECVTTGVPNENASTIRVRIPTG